MDELGIWGCVRRSVCSQCCHQLGQPGEPPPAPAPAPGRSPRGRSSRTGRRLLRGAALAAATCGCRRQERGICLALGGAGTVPCCHPQRALPRPALRGRGRSTTEPCSVFNPRRTRLKSVRPKALGSGQGCSSVILITPHSPGSPPKNHGPPSPCPDTGETEARQDRQLVPGSGGSPEARPRMQTSRSTSPRSPASPRDRAPRTGTRVNAALACPVPRTWAPFHLWLGASQRPHESQATPLPPKPLGQRLLQPFTHTNKNKSRCRPLNSAKASFPLAPRAPGAVRGDLARSPPTSLFHSRRILCPSLTGRPGKRNGT